tara:strand:- start:964 stop:1170 length:207 start_codon:yes stop_codon:yes gene_type:complete
MDQQYKSETLDLLIKLQRENSALAMQCASVNKLLGMVCEKLECDLKGLPAALESLEIKETTNANKKPA